jgi:Family of unknown function (DUF5677)
MGSDWLNRDISASGAHKLVEQARPVLQAAIDRAALVLDACQSGPSAEPDEDLPVLMSFMHLVEMADGVEILLSSASVHPAKLLLRSMLEALLTIDYILETDTRRRAFAWLVVRAHRRLTAFESMSSKTQSGKDLSLQIANDDIQIDLAQIPETEIDSAIANTREQLKEPNYCVAEAEYRRTKRLLKRNPEWFALYGGPVSIRDLAWKLRRLSTYQYLYKTWSELTHAGHGGRYLTTTKDGKAAFYALRNATDLLSVAHFASSFLLDAMQSMLRKYAPDELRAFSEWYVNEFRVGYLGLLRTRLNVSRLSQSQ